MTQGDKVGVFIVIGVVLNRIIDWIFDAIEEQNSEYAHLAFFKRVVNVSYLLSILCFVFCLTLFTVTTTV